MICRELLLDNAGEQRDDCKSFNQHMNGLKDGACLRKYSDPSRETTKATQEAAVKFFEITLKKLLLQGNLPIEDWPNAEEKGRRPIYLPRRPGPQDKLAE
jgi:hypothetical protein